VKATRIETDKAKSLDEKYRHSSKTPVPPNFSNVKEGYSVDSTRQRNSKTPLPPSSDPNQNSKEVSHPKPTIKNTEDAKNDANQQTSSFYGTRPDWDDEPSGKSEEKIESRRQVFKNFSPHPHNISHQQSPTINRIEQSHNEMLELSSRKTPLNTNLTKKQEHSKRNSKSDEIQTSNNTKLNHFKSLDENNFRIEPALQKTNNIHHRHSIGPDFPFYMTQPAYNNNGESYKRVQISNHINDFNFSNELEMHLLKKSQAKEKVDLEPPKKKVFNNEAAPQKQPQNMISSKTPDILHAGNFFANYQDSIQVNTNKEALATPMSSEKSANEKERDSPKKSPNTSDSSSSSRKSSITKAEQKSHDIEVCMIGSSMIHPINIKNLFPDRVCMFKCILGGYTRDCYEFIKRKKDKLKNCKCFILVCASNDCDSLTNMSYLITEYLNFALYLHDNFPNAKLLFSKLVPRLISANVTIQEFEQRRVLFNDFLHGTLPNILPCTIITHSKFENKERLMELLYDGVHFSDKAVPIYEKKLKKVIASISF
jgi:hypothetical protein